MKIQLFAVTKEKKYDAQALYVDGKVTVLKGSKIKIPESKGYKPSIKMSNMRKDSSLVDNNGIVLQDLEFGSLSTSASFVTGRSTNGFLLWKTKDGILARDFLNKSGAMKEKAK